MQTLKIQLENCYGIKKFDEELSFASRKANIIYAPNGVMKTSFALTMDRLSRSEKPEDRIYPERETKWSVKDQTNADIPAEQIFVIKPLSETYISEKISTLLVNEKLKKEHDEIISEIDDKKQDLLKLLKKSSGLSPEKIEEELSKSITRSDKQFLIALGRIEKEVLDEPKTTLSEIIYKNIFNEKVESFLNTKGFKEKLEKYTEIYDQILSHSKFFKKGIFNHYQAGEIAKNLKSHGFFEAEHSVYVNINDPEKKEIKTEKELSELIQKEKEAILNTPELVSSFEEIDNKLKSNADLRGFREYLLQNQEITRELVNPELFKEKLWKAYLIDHLDAFKLLMEVYNKGKQRLKEISEEASNQATRWQDVINIFNRRFSVPFIVSIENKQDVILNRVSPNIKFQFKEEDGEPVSVEKDKLFKVLSNGERRALYLLNIIFEVEARKEEQQQTLFIIDDIADSFDYKNKYAIVEYLSDILNEGDFYQIILTHNYDFYRTVSSRLDLGRTKYHVLKNKDAVKLTKDPHYKNPFSIWKNDLNNSVHLVASIPFVRNIVEYCGNEICENLLTALLHVKDNSEDVTIKDVEDIYKKVLSDQGALALDNPEKKVFEMIFEVADSIADENDEEVELEKKIVLSIATRLKTEMFLIDKIDDPAYVKDIKRNQTINLIKKYKEKFLGDESERENIITIERVNLMTPQNIHVNSFMYEPIMDMSSEHLKNLYKEISSL